MELLDQILSRPDANLLVQRARDILQSEQQLRDRFYQEISPNDKAEFIQGEIIWHSPVTSAHNRITGRIYSLLNAWVVRYQLGMVGVEKLLISLSRNDYEPDVCFFHKRLSDTFLPDQMKFPVPALVVEVLSPSTEERDRGVKFQDYALHGVGEYWIVDPDQCQLEQYQLLSGQYELLQKSGSGVLKSHQIQGFQVDIDAFFSDEGYLDALKRLMDTSFLH